MIRRDDEGMSIARLERAKDGSTRDPGPSSGKRWTLHGDGTVSLTGQPDRVLGVVSSAVPSGFRGKEARRDDVLGLVRRGAPGMCRLADDVLAEVASREEGADEGEFLTLPPPLRVPSLAAQEEKIVDCGCALYEGAGRGPLSVKVLTLVLKSHEGLALSPLGVRPGVQSFFHPGGVEDQAFLSVGLDSVALEPRTGLRAPLQVVVADDGIISLAAGSGLAAAHAQMVLEVAKWRFEEGAELQLVLASTWGDGQRDRSHAATRKAERRFHVCADGTITPEAAPNLVLGAAQQVGAKLRLVRRGSPDACVIAL